MVGNATLTMVVSSTIISCAAEMTARATPRRFPAVLLLVSSLGVTVAIVTPGEFPDPGPFGWWMDRTSRRSGVVGHVPALAGGFAVHAAHQ
ncbi:MAG TPA: hypothetical protein VG253_02830 [Streptosporangiaceae bacterium]|nr:hypothetical protein [Streptosporangiaceae bacterium]